MAKLQKISPRWTDQTVIVAAPGPSLTKEVAAACEGQNAVAINDAYRLFPWADVLYACDAEWWDVHSGCPDFVGERWSSHGITGRHNDKSAVAEKYDLNLIAGKDREGFSFDPAVIHYGSNSTFQAVNLTILMGAKRIVLVGVNMQHVDGKSHFFGSHGPGLRNVSSYVNFVRAFERAAKLLPPEIQIVNATPRSALKCFPAMGLEECLA